MVKADPKSDKYLSFIGSLDVRVNMDDVVRREDSKYYPALSMMASKASYNNEAYLKTTVENYWKVW